MDDRTTVSGRRAPVLAAVFAAVLVFVAAAVVAAAGAATAPTSTTLPEPVYAGPLAGEARGAAAVPHPGSGGWFWPIGTEDFNGWSGWLDPRGSYVHVAQDMPCPAGHAVYAIGDGVVFISRADAGGYGVGASPGGCIIITHRTASGIRFHALYGHVSSLRVKEGERVHAGQVIALVNGCRHLHFSTHPGARYRDGNPYAGHVPKSWADHGGYVDPVKFLKTNPRAAAYRPPALSWTQITTRTAPLQYGAAAGVAYWTEEGGAGDVAWRDDLATGERRVLGADEVVPPFDGVRYATAPLDAPAVGFAVADHRPALDLAADHASPAWGAEARLTATLANTGGAPLKGAFVRLQRFKDQQWRVVWLGVTDALGRAAFSFSPTAATSLRVTFAPPAKQPATRIYLATRSRTVEVVPHVALTVPKAPATVAAGELLTAAGDLTPRHAAGADSVALVFQRRAGGDWVTELTVPAVSRDLQGHTRYTGRAHLEAAGAWRVRAVHPNDGAHALTTSAWRHFTVE